ncbi:MAG: hypothetical protein JST22_14140 [Bacteroidetes bacterium]|nr:hypothetical protein [Bacteroidota bacterium]
MSALLIALLALCLGSVDASAQHGKHGGRSAVASAKKGKKGSQSSSKGHDSRKKGKEKKGKEKKGRERENSRKKSRSEKKSRASAKATSRRERSSRGSHERTARHQSRRESRPASTSERERTTPSRVEHPVATPPQSRGAAAAAATLQGVDIGPADLAQQTLHGRGLPAGARGKRPPPAVQPLTGDQLRSISEQAPETNGRPAHEYPESQARSSLVRPFYAEGTFGLYTTGALKAGYAGTSWPYDYALHFDLNGSNGFVDNAARSAFTLGASGGYVIGNNYGIFSGGFMGAEAEYQRSSYQRYGSPNAPERKRNAWSAVVNGRNSNNGVSFELQGGYRQLTLDENGTTDESSLDGLAKLRVEFSRLAIGGEANLDLTNLGGTSISLGRLEAYARYALPIVTLRVGGSIGVGRNSDGQTLSRLAPRVELNFYPFRGVTLAAGIDGGITQNSLRDLLDRNPYVERNPMVHHEVEGIGYRAALRFEPRQSFALRLSLSRRSLDDYLFFARSSDALFAPHYGSASTTDVSGDLYWELGDRDMVALKGSYTMFTLDSTGAQAPFQPQASAEAMYVKRLESMPLSLTGTLRYIGVRQDDGGADMKAVVLLGAIARYSINSHFYGTLEISNLTNATYELWSGYRERGIFGAVGLGVSY